MSAKRHRIWRACEKCGEWNLADHEDTAALLADCGQQLESGRPTVAFAGVRSFSAGKFQLSEIDGDPNVELLVQRYQQRMTARSNRAYRLGVRVSWMISATIAISTLTIGGTEGSIIGVLVAAGGLAITSVFQRKRSLVVAFNDGEQITMTRAMANDALLVCDGTDFALHTKTTDGARVFQGERALRVLSRILDRNAALATEEQIHEAASTIEASSCSEETICNIVQRGSQTQKTSTQRIGTLRGASSLALAMLASLQHEREILEREALVFQKRNATASEVAQIIDRDLSIDSN